jgi:hypothetical protein
MKCPVDDTTLAMSTRNGVEIDYCPTCRGVWLDRGELDKILERAAAEAGPPVTLAEPPRAAAARADQRPDHRADDRHDGRRTGRDDDRHDDRRRHRDDDDDDDYRRRPKRRESFLSDLFDF